MLVEFHAGADSQKVFALGEQSLSVAREMELKELMGYVLGNLTWAYFNHDALEPARQANAEAQAIWLELGNLPMLADSYTLEARYPLVGRRVPTPCWPSGLKRFA